MSRTAASISAALLTSFSMGCIHAFSVLGVAIEQSHAVDRATASAVYSLALVCLTFAVLVSPLLYRHFSALSLTVGAFLVSVAGIALCAAAEQTWQLFVGYGVVFGCANGVGYALSLVVGATARPDRKGLIMSLVTAAYAVGAAVAAQILGWAMPEPAPAEGFAAIMYWLIGFGAIAVALLRYSRLRTDETSSSPRSRIPHTTVALLWFTYGTAVFAGLMAIAHAAGIAKLHGGDGGDLALAAMLVALGNAVGGLASALTADRWTVRRLLSMLPLFCGVGLALLAAVDSISLTMAGLVLVGFGYGATIAAYPPCVARIVGMAAYAKVYGRMFTAWGVAGLIAPWLAGRLFVLGASYTAALMVATALAVCSVIAVAWLPRDALAA